MPETTPEQLLAAKDALLVQWDQLEEAKTGLKVKAAELTAERVEINGRQNDLVQAMAALGFRAGELERGANVGTPNEAVEALISAAVAEAEGAPQTATVGDATESAEVTA